MNAKKCTIKVVKSWVSMGPTSSQGAVTLQFFCMQKQKLTVLRDSEGESASLVNGKNMKKGKYITKPSVHNIFVKGEF